MTVDLAVRVQPRARRDEVVALRDGVLVVRVTAPAIDGRANKALCRFIADRLGVRASAVAVVRGERSRDKVLRVEGVDREEVEAVLGASAGQPCTPPRGDGWPQRERFDPNR